MGRFHDLLQDDYLILHGALGTELEFLGYDVSGKLWSAKYLLDKPDLIQAVHETYLQAGADLVTTSSYQATLPGLREAGLSDQEAETIIRLTVTLAKQARDKVWKNLTPDQKKSRPYPLISGDVGPYAAYLADGSEYTGAYGNISKAALKDFHRPRIQYLLDEGVDLLALETIPSQLEAQALIELLAEDFPDTEAYISFTSQDGVTISDGSPIKDLARLADNSPQVLALGLNCSPPAIYDAALQQIAVVTDKPLVTYPNSGETYDGANQTWQPAASASPSLLDNTRRWQQLGAKVLGGCCRTRPSDIERLSKGLRKQT